MGDKSPGLEGEEETGWRGGGAFAFGKHQKGGNSPPRAELGETERVRPAVVQPLEGRLLLLGYFSLCKSNACSLENVVIHFGESVVETEQPLGPVLG